MKNTPFIAVTSQPVPYHADTTAIFNTLCQQNSNSLLLDSAEIGSKNSLQSLILINAAVKITCLGNQVTFRALNANGKQVLKEIHPVLGQLGTVSAVNFDDEFSVQFAPLDNQLDEDSKLQAATIFDGLRSFLSIINIAAHQSFWVVYLLMTWSQILFQCKVLN